jgi:hypothetical protein
MFLHDTISEIVYCS